MVDVRMPPVIRPSVLLLLYKRVTNLENILQIIEKAQVTCIYISIDGVNQGDDEGYRIQEEIIRVIDKFKASFLGEVYVKRAIENLGIAVNVFRSVEWVLLSEELVIVLEDDCLPTPSFFDYCSQSIEVLFAPNKVSIVGGSQFVPNALTNGEPYISKYPLTWGWMTSRDEWKNLRFEVETFAKRVFWKQMFCLSPERSFWLAGARRALFGYTDVWDTLVVCVMLEKSRLSVLPGQNLVVNVGNDIVATHTGQDNPWINFSSSEFKGTLDEIQRNLQADQWLKSEVFQIKLRHVISTKITLLADLLGVNRKKFELDFLTRLSGKE